jgi:hypothetical protein
VLAAAPIVLLWNIGGINLKLGTPAIISTAQNGRKNRNSIRSHQLNIVQIQQDFRILLNGLSILT